MAQPSQAHIAWGCAVPVSTSARLISAHAMASTTSVP
jgi:hypothetical protein